MGRRHGFLTGRRQPSTLAPMSTQEVSVFDAPRPTRLRRGWGGFRATLPVALGVVPFGFAYGAVAARSMALGQSQLMSLTVFAGTAQFIAASMLAEGAAYLPVLVTGVLINLRLALLSAALTPHVRRVPTATRPLLAQMLTDESFAVSMASFQRDGPDALFYLGSGLCIYAFWQAATALGYLFGAGLPGGLGLDYALPASLVALLFLLVRERRTAMVAGLAAAAAVLLRPLVSGAWATLLATLLVCTVGVVARRWR